jgi:hypothetical protein
MKLLSYLAIFVALLPGMAHSTVQLPDQFMIGSERYSLLTEPLYPYLTKEGKYALLVRHFNDTRCTASWRRYVAQWRIHEERLVLEHVFANPCNLPKEVPLDELFPGQDRPIVATWYSGLLVVLLRKQTQGGGIGLVSKDDRYLTMIVLNGAIVSREESAKRPY